MLPQLLSVSSSFHFVRLRAQSRLNSASGFSLIEVALTCFLLSIMTVSVLTLFAQVGSYQSSTRAEAAVADTVAQARATIMNQDACTEMMFGTSATGTANLPLTFNPLTAAGSLDLATGIYALKKGQVDPAQPLLKVGTPLPGQVAGGLRVTSLFLTNKRMVYQSEPGFEVAQYDIVARFSGSSSNSRAVRPTTITPMRIGRFRAGAGTELLCAKFGEAGIGSGSSSATTISVPVECADGMRRFSLQSPTCL